MFSLFGWQFPPFPTCLLSKHMEYLFQLPLRIFSNRAKHRWRLMLPLYGPTPLCKGHVSSEATKTWSHTGFPPSCKHCHLCLLAFMAKLEVLLLEIEPRPLLAEGTYFALAPPICCILYTSKSAALSCSFKPGKGFYTSGIQSRILYRSEIKLVFVRKHRLCATCGSIAPAHCWRGIHLASGEVPCVELYFCAWVWQNWWQDSSGGWMMPALK